MNSSRNLQTQKRHSIARRCAPAYSQALPMYEWSSWIILRIRQLEEKYMTAVSLAALF